MKYKTEDVAFYALVFLTFKIIWIVLVTFLTLGVSCVVFVFEFIKINWFDKE